MTETNIHYQRMVLHMEKLYLTPEEESQVRALKTHFHRFPELSWKEYETTARIREELKKLDGIEFLDGIIGNGLKEGQTAPTGVIAKIKGKLPGKTVALRADIDALACRELADAAVKSELPGAAHTCGHDFHTASLLGAAMILSRIRSRLPGEVILLFQPAEETTDGAEKLIEAGMFEKLHMDYIFGLHNRPEVETGKIVVKKGPLMSMKDNFKIILHGAGGHGSMPQKCTDPIVCAAALIQAVQTIISRNTDPLEAAVITIGSIHGGTHENLIIEEVEMTGSMRSFDQATHDRALQRLKDIIRLTAETYECGWELQLKDPMPAVNNSADMYKIACKAVETAFGPETITDAKPSLASEDFSRFMKKVPGFFYWIGNRKPDDACYSWHNAKFHCDDDALKYGAVVLAQSVLAANEA